ncbi:MAG: hypothetical protein Q9181_000089 [Wetmoreana brouardii]
MYYSPIILALAVLPAFSSALPQSSQGGRVLDGYATFNDYGAQKTGVNCNTELWQQSGKQKLVDNQRIFGAATSDVAKGLGTYKCDYSDSDMKSNLSVCTVQKDGNPFKLPSDDMNSPDFYKPPFCSGARCGTCYTITNTDNQKKVTVQILDACPAQTAWNYCKTTIAANQRCGDPDTNQVDIDLAAYPALTDGQTYQSGKTPNLNIKITDNPSCSA